MVLNQNNFLYFKWKYRAGAGAVAEIMDKGEAKKEPEPKINNFGSAINFNLPLLIYINKIFVLFQFCMYVM